jgi:hypothetical protein
MISNRKIKVFDAMRFIMAVVLLAGLSLFAESCNRNENQDEIPNNDNEKVQSVSDSPGRANRTNVQQLLAIAVDKSFENNVNEQLSTKSLFGQTVAENYPLHISYPYDYIKIYDVVKFSCAGVKSPIVQSICGDGEVEIYLASFALFKEADIKEEQNEEKQEKEKENEKQETDEIEYVLLPGIERSDLTDMVFGEPMIVFKSDLGIYSCISNGGGVVSVINLYAGYYIEFSSHKYLSEKALEKDATSSIYQFHVNIRSDEVTLSIPDVKDSEIPLNNQQIVSSEELFSLIELNNIPEISVQCKVTGLAENYFTVVTNETSNLKQVYFDEYTEFFIDNTSTTSNSIAVNDMITITYNKLYGSYNPKSVVANKITR